MPDSEKGKNSFKLLHGEDVPYGLKGKVARPNSPHLPAMEVVRDEIFDTKEIEPNGETSILTFFMNPSPREELSNMMASGQFPFPQRFHLFGLTLFIFSVHERYGAKAIRAGIEFDQIARKLFLTSHIRYRIGAKPYLQVPTNSVIEGLVPSDTSMLTKNLFRIPDLTEENLQYLISEMSIYDSEDDKQVEVSKEDTELLVGPIIKKWEGMHYYNMAVYLEGKQRPLSIPPQQAFMGQISWAIPIIYDPDFFGRVFVRMGMAGLRWREIQ